MPQGSYCFPPRLCIRLLAKPKLTDDRVALRIRQLCKRRLHGLSKIPLFDILKGFFCCFIW